MLVSEVFPLPVFSPEILPGVPQGPWMAGRDPAPCSPGDHVSASTHQEGRPEPGSLLTSLPQLPKPVPVNAWMVPRTGRTPSKKAPSLPLSGSPSARPASIARPTFMPPCPSLERTPGSPVAPERQGAGGPGGCCSSAAPPVHPAGCRAAQPHLCKCMQICATHANLCTRTEPSRAGRSAPERRCRPRYK